MNFNIKYILGGGNCLSDLKSTLSLFFTQFSVFINKKFSSKASFAILLALYTLSILSLLRENVNYRDDLIRTFIGISGFSASFSRYTSENLSHALHADKHFLADISPIPQLIAVIELSLASLYLLKGITGKRKFTVFQLAASLTLGLNPYFLECLSFKFDAPYMALSVLCAVTPLLFIRHHVMFFISVLISVLIICTSYQVSLGILPMTVIFTLLSLYIKGDNLKEIFKTGTVFALSFIVGLVIFKTMIMQPVETYASNAIPPLNLLPHVFIEHMKNYYSLVYRDFSKFLKFSVVTGCVLFIILSVVHSKNNRLSTFALSVVTLVLGALLTYGFYALLERPIFDTRAMYGIGALIACIFICCVSLKDLYITKICSVCIAWSFIVLTSAYGNALVAQRDWEKFRMEEVIHDLSSIENKGQNFKYKVIGSSGLAPKIQFLRNTFPVLNRLIPVTYCDSEYFFGTRGFEYFYGLKNMAVDNTITDTGKAQHIKETMYHQIKVFDDKVLITLK